MWPETWKRVELELSQLHHLLQSQSDLLSRAKEQEPTGTELLAIAALLHSFYTGIENAFKRIAAEIDGRMPTGQKSHADLLLQMESGTEKRPAVISEGLRLRLGEYMNFRHVFRHAYSFELQWSRMKGLVLNVEDTLSQFGSAMQAFFDAGPDRQPTTDN